MFNLLITGITGFLGRSLVKYIKDNKIDINIYGFGHSEKKIAKFKRLFSDIPVIIISLDRPSEVNKIEFFIEKYKITHIIHNAGMKYINICEDNRKKCYETNIDGSKMLCKIANKFRIKNLIAISTDKANQPISVYGFSKNAMEYSVIEAGFKIYQGINFFGSDGSVLDIWREQYNNKQPLTYTSGYQRYFSDIDDVCKELIKGFLNPENKLFPEKVFLILIDDLLDAFKDYYQYDNCIKIDAKIYEKKIEKINKFGILYLPKKDDMIKMLEKVFK